MLLDSGSTIQYSLMAAAAYSADDLDREVRAMRIIFDGFRTLFAHEKDVGLAKLVRRQPNRQRCKGNDAKAFAMHMRFESVVQECHDHLV